jgi:4-hydroxybenzoyl-CoA reductase alpha subunit
MGSFSVVGKNIPKVDAIAKATGFARFVADIELPGMLIGKILRSSLPHAKIVNIDTNKAEKLRGVKAVIKASDTPKIKFCAYVGLPANKMPLQDDKVRFIGDEIAAVAAIDEDVAQEALDLIEVDYEELSPVFDPKEAMEPGAPKIHDAERNISAHIVRHFGNIEEGFSRSDFIFEDEFVSPAEAICCLETHGAIAEFDRSGNLTFWCSTQVPHQLQGHLAVVLNMPFYKIRVVKPHVGGGFGNKTCLHPMDPICALLAKRTNRPVKLVFERDEEFETARTRYPAVIGLKTGVKKDGTLIAREFKVVVDNGAYDNKGASITEYIGIFGSSLYRVPNVKFDGYLVYTNKQWCDSYRGRGNPQPTFAIESQMDKISRELGIDPVELRLKNASRLGDVTVFGIRVNSSCHADCIRGAAEAVSWKEKKKRKQEGRGVGIASMIHTGGGVKGLLPSHYSDAILKVNIDGSVNLLTGESDVGQGSDTVLCMIAAEELGVKFEHVNVGPIDTYYVPTSLGTWGTRVTYMGGNAVKIAAAEAKKQIIELAAEMMECKAEDLEIKDSIVFVKGSSTKSIPLSEVTRYSYRMKNKAIVSRGLYEDQISTPSDPETGFGNLFPTVIFAAHAIEVEVDKETGNVKILNFAACHDVGRSINPHNVEGQIEGGIAQGIGYALTEKVTYDNGKVLNPNFVDYKIVTALEMPRPKIVLLESPDPNGPFGAKGVAEAALVPTAPAISNAIYDAVGIQIKELPITPEKILNALKLTQR